MFSNPPPPADQPLPTAKKVLKGQAPSTRATTDKDDDAEDEYLLL